VARLGVLVVVAFSTAANAGMEPVLAACSPAAATRGWLGADAEGALALAAVTVTSAAIAAVTSAAVRDRRAGETD